METAAPEMTAASQRRRWWRRVEPLVWVFVLAVVVIWRWPVLKGWAYRTTGATAPAASFHWQSDLGAALDEARRAGKTVFVDFHASWCGPCLAMAHDVWPDPEVGRELTRRHVPVSIDVDLQPTVADQYGVRGIPTVLVLDTDGRVLREATFLDRGGILRFLREDPGPGAH